MLSVKNIIKKYKSQNFSILNKKYFTAVDNVSLEVPENTIVGIVGQSGSGKTTLAEIIGGLQNPTSGEIFYNDIEIKKLNKEQYKEYRKNVQFIFQSPVESMNPYYKVSKILEEPMKCVLEDYNQKESIEKIEKMIEYIGLDKSYLYKYPKELSGGEAQRIAIARALLLNPKYIICDECVSALDVSVQAQILNLLKNLQKEFSISYLFISHDLATVKYMSDKVIVMKEGKIVEKGNTEEVFLDPQSDYTKMILKYSRLKEA
ncbi:ABC transporter ATP-binding protein [Peptoniphilus obesi]|uniref:ABC transporter ATP-binding protein n=1 Tax=Peptoniphilus obesi TaxID=1472765 RepID=UPI0004B7D11C|nr:ATP-binding cassette domain-containing protein [Peptoniphilus obesi]